MIVAHLAEAHRDPKHHPRPFDQREFHPFERAEFLDALTNAIPEATEDDLDRLMQ